MDNAEVNIDDYEPEGGWLDTRPASGRCVDCGASVEPVPHPTENRWRPPRDACRDCRAERDRRRQKLEGRLDRFEREYAERSGVTRRKRALFDPQVDDGLDLEERVEALADVEMALNPTIAELLAIEPGNPNDRLDCGCYVYGPTGSGKTTQGQLAVRQYLARWLLRADGRHQPTVRYTSTADLLDELRACYGDSSRSAQEEMDTYREADLLVVDELGQEQATEHTAERLGRLIDHRCESLAPTLWLSNFGLRELPDESPVYDGRVVWRIFEQCGGSDGSSWRHVELAERNFRNPRSH